MEDFKMKKVFLFSATILLVSGLALISCSKSSTEPEPTETKKLCKVSIPSKFVSSKAVADGGVASFSTSDNIFVENMTRHIIDAYTLHPDANTPTANITGLLTADNYSVGDNLDLWYNTSNVGIVDYTTQDLTLDNVVDAATASAQITTKTAENITISNASFTNLQSIFKFTFKHSGTVLNVKSVHIVSEGNKLVQKYNAITGADTYGSITATNTTAQSATYIALRFTPTANDPIHFIIMDESGNFYSATKNAPSSGFAINKFYNSTINVTAGLTDGFDRFTVHASSPTTVVYFSPGNLVYEGANTYSFETIPFNTNKGSLGYGGSISDETIRGYFQWRHIATSSDTPITISVYLKSWRILTETEWNGVLGFGIGSYRTMKNSNVARYYNIKDLNNNMGLLLPPDDATETDVSGLTSGSLTTGVDYKNYIAKGFVFLPCAGCCLNGSWSAAGTYGHYLSSSEVATTEFKRLYIYSSGINVLNSPKATRWDSVRLVHE